jgi:hypothetical protein
MDLDSIDELFFACFLIFDFLYHLVACSKNSKALSSGPLFADFAKQVLGSLLLFRILRISHEASLEQAAEPRKEIL